MNYARRLYNCFYFRVRRAVKLVRLYYLVALVNKGRAVHRDFFTHLPCGMVQSLRRRNVFKLSLRIAPERSAARRNYKFFERRVFIVIETLPDCGMLTVDRNNLRAFSRGKTSY